MSGIDFSGLLNSAKKVFEAPIQLAGKAIQAGTDVAENAYHAIMNSPVLKTVAIAAAVYFTAGIAMAYFAPTAGFAAAMPGVSTVSGALGIAAPAAADAGTVAAGTTAAAAGADTAAAAGTTAAAAAPETGGLASGALAGEADPMLAHAAATAGAGGGAWTPLEKVAAAKVASDAIGGALAPSPQQEAAAAKKFQGAFFGQGTSEGGTNTQLIPPGGFNLAQNTQPPATPPGPTAPASATAQPGFSSAAPSLAGVTQPPAPTMYNLIPPQPARAA